MTELALSRVHFPVSTLGPGRRVGVWFQGCTIRCPGCISLDTWAPGRGLTTVAATLEAVSPHLADADGLTVSGGEPFDQPDALRVLLRGWRERHAGDVLVYSGYPLEALEAALGTMRDLIDAVVADPYLEHATDTLALRGSDNQRLAILTELGRDRFGGSTVPRVKERTLDVMFDDARGEAFLAGIPRRGDLARLRSLLAAQGHEVTFTQDVRP